MAEFNKSWFFAGGWAIDLFLGRETRHHDDVEIALFRGDQLDLKAFLKDWEMKYVRKGEFYHWEDEFLELPIHEIHARNPLNGEHLEILLNEMEDGEWRFRRNLSIFYPCQSVWSYTDSGIPYLNPEIVVLYKAKNIREKDEQDFLAVKDHLKSEAKTWLQDAIRKHCPNHKWLYLL